MIDEKAEEIAHKLASDHWSYIEALMITYKFPQEVIEPAGFHYKTAMIHGFKHGYEYAKDNK